MREGRGSVPLMDPESAWMAGLLEGEGTFRTEKTKFGFWVPCLAVKMTDRDVLERFTQLAGGTVRLCGRTDAPAHWKDAYRVTLKGEAAREVMVRILPYMGERRTEKIRAVLRETGYY